MSSPQAGSDWLLVEVEPRLTAPESVIQYFQKKVLIRSKTSGVAVEDLLSGADCVHVHVLLISRKARLRTGHFELSNTYHAAWAECRLKEEEPNSVVSNGHQQTGLMSGFLRR